MLELALLVLRFLHTVALYSLIFLDFKGAYPLLTLNIIAGFFHQKTQEEENFSGNFINMHACKGISLIELLSVLAIIAIISLLTAFFSRDLLQNNAATTYINQLAGAIQFARNEAITRGETLTLCPSKDQKTCSGTWRDHHIVFVDKNTDKQINNDEEIIRIWPALPTGASLEWRAFGARYALQLQPHGFTNKQNGTFVYCPPHAKPQLARGLIITQSGRVRFTQIDPATGVHLDGNGELLSCNN